MSEKEEEPTTKKASSKVEQPEEPKREKLCMKCSYFEMVDWYCEKWGEHRKPEENCRDFTMDVFD